MSNVPTGSESSLSKPRRLGRGLSALLAEAPPVAVAVSKQTPILSSAASEGDAGRVLSASVDLIDPSPFQPREVFAPEALRELADSIRSAGVMQPILVRRRGDRFELVAGERRWRAARLAGLNEVPAIVVTIDDEKAAEWGLIENLQRQDLNAVERARAFGRLVERFRLTQTQVAERVGVDRTSVSNHLRMLELEPEILDLVMRGALNFGHARALLSCPPGPARKKLAQDAAREAWSVRQVEEEAGLAGREATESGGASGPGGAPRREPTSSEAIERQLGQYLGTKVRVKARAGGKKGRIEIEFYSLDHFDGLMQRMGAKLHL